MGRISDKKNGSVTTSGSTSATLVEYTLPDDCIASVTVTVEARKASNGVSAVLKHELSVKRHSGSDATIIGQSTDLLSGNGKDVSAALWTASYDDNGANLRVTANPTGEIGGSIVWSASMALEIFT